jgi:hypothetical protein
LAQDDAKRCRSTSHAAGHGRLLELPSAAIHLATAAAFRYSAPHGYLFHEGNKKEKMNI